MELLGDINVLSIAFITGVVAHFVVQKFKSHKRMTIQEAWAYTAIVRPGKIFPFYSTMAMRTKPKPNFPQIAVDEPDFVSKNILKKSDLMSMLGSTEKADEALDRIKNKKIDDLKLQIIASNPTGLFVGFPDVNAVASTISQVVEEEDDDDDDDEYEEDDDDDDDEYEEDDDDDDEYEEDDDDDDDEYEEDDDDDV